MEVLDEERQARQIHLVLQTLDIANSSYESLSSPEPEMEPLQKKGVSKKESVKKEGHMNKKPKLNIKKEKGVKVCCTML